jgi:cytochrome c oxidase cbb3-type subunit 3
MRSIKLVGALIATALLAGFLSSCAIDSPASDRTDSPEQIAKARNKPVIRGGIVYRAYCILCHGERADGDARASKLYGIVNLNPFNGRDYIEKIIRYGGKAVGRSEVMPSWQEELSEEQISDVIAYVEIARDQVSRGNVVYKTNCILCHGVKADGKGRASILFDPPPANLTLSDKNDEYKKMIITLGGKAMARSPVMPIWGEQLSEQQIDDVVAYLHTILVRQVE